MIMATPLASAGALDVAHCSPIFEDTFDAEALGLNKATLAHWTISDGTIDVIGAGGAHDIRPGHGRYLDMDGSTSNAGKITSKAAFALTTGTYVVEFELSGNARNTASDSVTITFGTLFTETITLPGAALFKKYHREIAVPADQSARLSFEGIGGDNMGLLLDDVMLCRSTATASPSWYASAGGLTENACAPSGTVVLAEGASHLFTSDVAATETFTFGTNTVWGYSIQLSEGYTGTYEVQVGRYDGTFTSLGSATVAASAATRATGTVTVTGAFDVVPGDRLALLVKNVANSPAGSAITVVTGQASGDCTLARTYLGLPANAPPFPTPELGSLALVGLGAIAAVIVLRRRA
ncbi:MAG TPA: hypothetical protein VM889_00370 [Candidatus Thermoplasmatota archaeon]|nr:hypothetical protein [Candidatus Thermoplasmatota archaeon]